MDTIPLSHAPSGSTVAVKGEVQDDGTVLLTDPDGGTTSLALAASQQVFAVELKLSVGDVMQNTTSGLTAVVRWVSEDGRR